MRDQKPFSGAYLVRSVYFLVAALALSTTISLSAETYHGVVIRVVDGDTVKVRISNTKIRVRLLGIDAPEDRDNEKARKDAARQNKSLAILKTAGLRSQHFLETLVKDGDTVTLETEKNEYDAYGRLCAYLYDRNGAFVNRAIVAEGFAGVFLDYIRNNQKAAELTAAFDDAKNHQRGLWSDGLVLPYRWKRKR